MDYDFFEYKYNYVGYNGEDFESLLRLLYPVIALILITVLLKRIRKKGWKDISGFLKVLSI